MLSIHEVPALRFLIPFVFGIVVAYLVRESYSELPGVWFWIAGGLSAAVIIQTIKYTYRWRMLPSLALMLACSLAGFALFVSQIPGQEAHHIKYHPAIKASRDVLINGVCSQAPVTKNTTQVVLDVLWVKEADDIDWVSTSGRVILFSKSLGEGCAPRPGDRVMVKAKLTPPGPVVNPNAFDYGEYLWTQGILLTGFVEARDVVIEKSAPWYNLYTFTYLLRNAMMDRTYALIGNNEQADLICGLLFGYRDRIDVSTEEMFVNTGAVHLLAVSGMHVILIYANIRWLFRFLRLDRLFSARSVAVLAIISIWIFSFIVGLAPSIVRASMMLTLLILGEILKRHTNSMNLVSAGAVMILMYNPLTLFDVGFQLSFAAVLGIINLQKPIKAALPVFLNRIPHVSDLIAVTIAAQVATLPLILYYFHQFPTYFILTGIFAVFISDYVIKLGGIILLLSVFSMPLAQWFSLLWYWTAHALLVSVDLVNRLPGGLVDLIYFDVWMMVLLASAIILCMVYQYRPIKRFYFTLSVIFFSMFLFDFISLNRNVHTASIIFYSHSKFRVVELRNGLSSLVVADSIFTDKNFKDVVRPNVFAHAVKNIKTVRIPESHDARLQFGDNSIYMPSSHDAGLPAIDQWIFAKPNQRVTGDCQNHIVQYNFRGNQGKKGCGNFYNLKDSSKILNVYSHVPK